MLEQFDDRIKQIDFRLDRMESLVQKLSSNSEDISSEVRDLRREWNVADGREQEESRYLLVPFSASRVKCSEHFLLLFNRSQAKFVAISTPPPLVVRNINSVFDAIYLQLLLKIRPKYVQH